MDSLITLVAVILATGAIIEVWHKGSVFATWRAIVQAKQDGAELGSAQSLWTELLLCPFCKSYHLPIYLYAFLTICNYSGGAIATVAHILIFGLAATRASNLIEALLPKESKYEPERRLGS